MSEYYSIIYDEEELHYFYDNIVQKLNTAEVMFVSLSARNKYLTKEEREKYELGRTEMFAKTLVKKDGFLEFIKKLRRFECNKDGYLTKNGQHIPEEALSCYFNINPSNTILALSSFKNYIVEIEKHATLELFRGIKLDDFIVNAYSNLDNTFLSFVQRSRAKKHWIDIDMDIDKGFEPYKNEIIISNLREWNVEYHFIDTKSGYHLLLKKDTVKMNPAYIISAITLEYKNSKFYKGGAPEIMINKNEMIPLPGTYQAKHKVRMIRKEEEWN